MQTLARVSGLVRGGTRLRIALAAAALMAMFYLLPERPPNVAGARAALDTALTLAFGLMMLALGASAGRMLVAAFALDEALEPLERIILSFALGMALVGVGIFFVGLAGGLRTPEIALFIVLLAAVCAASVRPLMADFRETWLTYSQDGAGSRAAFLLLLGLVAGLGVVALTVALAPPWSYDGLMYHLEAPQIWLTSGRITSLPSLLQANGPLLTQMLYVPPVAFGRDSAAQIIHLAFAAALVAGVLAAGRRFIAPPGGWLAAGILLGIPIFPLWGTLAYADMTHALYEFLSVWSVLRWSGDQRARWLVLAASMAALAVGTKLMAAYFVPGLILWLVFQARHRGWKRAVSLGILFAGLVGLLALPWFVVNILELGDPVYPFLGGGPDWPPARVELLAEYVGSFGAGRGLADFLLLPFNLYARHDFFATLMSNIEYPSFLFPLALLIPMVALTRQLRVLALFSLFRVAAWFLSSQQLRFLLPLFPVLSLMTADVILGLERLAGVRVGRVRIFPIIVTALLVTTFIYASIFGWASGVFSVVSGRTTREVYLQRMVYDFDAMRFIMTRLPAEARVIHLWDGQGYYCDDRCLPDAGQVQWPYLHRLGGDVAGVRRELGRRGVTHVLLDLEGLNFMLQHDPAGTHRAAATFFLDSFRPACTNRVYEDPKVHVYRLTC